MIVDIEDVEIEAEENRIKIKVIVDWSKPSAGIVDVLKTNIALERWKLRNRLALVG